MPGERNDFDLLVIGAGPGGYIASIRAAQLGMRVLCVEKRKTLGGTCLNVGCIPSKALLDSSHRFHQIREEASGHGIHVAEVRLDLDVLMARKKEIVRQLSDGIQFLFKKNRIQRIQGEARLLGPGRVEVNPAEGQTGVIRAKAVLLATGSVPAELPFLRFDGERILSSTEVLSLEEVPEHLVVVGGGAIGLELGQVWSRLGARVTVVELEQQILPQADTKLARLLQRSLKKQGMEIYTGTRIQEAKTEQSRVRLLAETRGKARELVCDRVLVAVGRRPFTLGLGLEEAGVRVEQGSGRVVVDDNYSTSVEGVYAIGDLVDGPMLAHKAEEEGISVAEFLAGEKPKRVHYEILPHVVYTWPEFASVGLTEREAAEQAESRGRGIKVGSFPFSACGRARCAGETDGAVKILAEEESGKVLGVHILGPHASELVAEAAVAVEMGARAEDIAGICHAHPTLSEALKEAALAVDKKALHV